MSQRRILRSSIHLAIASVFSLASTVVFAGNTVTGSYAVVAGGDQNTASGNYAAIGGGEYNAATSGWSVVGGGYYNYATAQTATVSGGHGK